MLVREVPVLIAAKSDFEYSSIAPLAVLNKDLSGNENIYII